MPSDRAVSFLSALSDSQLLENTQIEELGRTPEAKRSDPSALAQFIQKRGWLTAFQADMVLQGRACELQLGPYRLLDRLGEGGMGQVFKATHQVMNRTVALKVIRKDRLASAGAVERFYREVKAAAQLAHPNIAMAYDAGEVGGTHYLAMEYIDGVDLNQLVKDSGPLPVARACDYIRQAAAGLQHAHAKGMVHRDIKPANLLLARSDGVVKLLDMGLARLKTPGAKERSLTQLGTVMGTPEYLAPEQALDAHAADIRSDLYSLGCTLFYLLTGQPTFRGTSLTEILLKHQTEEAPALTSLRPGVPAGVEAVVRKLLAKEPEHRYQTPAELMGALEPFVNPGSGTSAASKAVGERKRAHRPQTPPPRPRAPSRPMRPIVEVAVAQPARKPVWPLVAALAGACLVALVIGGGVLLWPSDLWPHKVKSDQAHAAGPGPTADNPVKPAISPEPPPKLERIKPPVVEKLPNEAGPGAPADKPPDPEPSIPQPGREPRKAEVKQEVPKGPGDETSIKKREAKPPPPEPPKPAVKPRPPKPEPPREVFTLKGHNQQVTSVAFSPDGKRLASGAYDKVVKVWDAQAGYAVLTLTGHTDKVLSVAFSPDGKRLASATEDWMVKIWDMGSGKEIRTLKEHKGKVTSVAFSPDGSRLASAAFDGTVKVWDVKSGKEIRTLTGHASPVTGVVFSPDGSRLASASMDKTVKVWDAMSGKESRTLPGHSGYVHGVAFSPDGRFLAQASQDKTVKVWDAMSGQEIRTLTGHTDKVLSVAFSPDGKRLASASEDNTLKLWDLQSGQQTFTLNGHTSRVSCVAFSPDGKLLASASGDGTVKVWDVSSSAEALTREGLDHPTAH